MAIGLLCCIIGLVSALGSTMAFGLYLIETGVIYITMAFASMALLIAFALVDPQANSRAQ
jgi:hypothetical protein